MEADSIFSSSFYTNIYTPATFIFRKLLSSNRLYVTQAYYSNQWVRDTSGEWHELTSARFTADATARKGSRMDYAGGVEDGLFYMKNCGFFDDFTEIDSYHDRPSSGEKPRIDLDELP